MKIINVVASFPLLALAIAPGAFALGSDDDPASQQSPTAAGTNSAPSNSAPAGGTAQSGFGRAVGGTGASGGFSSGGGGAGGGGWKRVGGPGGGGGFSGGGGAGYGAAVVSGGGGGFGGGSWTGGGSISSDEVMQQVRHAIELAIQSTDSALADAARAASAALKDADRATKVAVQSQVFPRMASFQNNLKRLDRGSSRDEAAVIVTHPMDHKSSADLQQDIRVMDQLLRDEIARIDGNSLPQAMGINLMRSSRSSEPMYLEDYGVVFSYRASFTLAGAEASAPKKAENPDHPTESAWDRAKAELDSPQDAEADGATARQNAQHLQSQLIHSILMVLPEARNIRNLKESDSVVVTVSGSSDAGKPVRLTLKAKKADINRVADGSLKPEEFRAQVVWTIN